MYVWFCCSIGIECLFGVWEFLGLNFVGELLNFFFGYLYVCEFIKLLLENCLFCFLFILFNLIKIVCFFYIVCCRLERSEIKIG